MMRHARVAKYILFITVLIVVSLCQYGMAKGRKATDGRASRSPQQPSYTTNSQKTRESQRDGHPASTYHSLATGPVTVPQQAGSATTSEWNDVRTAPRASSKSVSITPTEFIKALHACNYPLPNYEQYQCFKEGLHYSQISSRTELAMFLAQVMHESNGLTEKVERRCATNPTVACANDYIFPELDVPHQQYFGRGYIQLTWSYNYKAASMAIFGDDRLLHNPGSILNSEKLMWRVSFWYWDAFVHSLPAVTEEGAFGITTLAINGAQECHNPDGHPVALSRYQIYVRVCQVLGIEGPLNPTGCYPCHRYDETYYMKWN